MKILYLFSGSRKKVMNKIEEGVLPDTQLYGFNHFHELDVCVETKEFEDIYPKFVGQLLGFRLKHLLLYFITPKYDVVFGSSILYFMIFKKIFKSKTRYLLLNISLNRLLITHKNNKLFLKFLLSLVKEIDEIVCLSNFQLEQLINDFGISREKLIFAPLGVDTFYHRAVFGGRKKYILSVGRDNGRDYKTLMEVASLLPQKNFEVVCSKRNLVGVSSVPENVKVYFDLSQEELKKKYEEAQTLILVTHDDKYKDGSDCSGQTVLLDAASSGLPIIASRKQYIKDYFEEDKEILMVDFYNPNEIVSRIKEIEDSTRSLALAKQARKKVENYFSTPQMSKNLMKVFRSIK